jgi:muconolactone delta-isomerase
MSTYKAEVELIDAFKPTFSKLIPSQRKRVNTLMNEGLIVSYGLAMDRSKLWIVFEAKNLEEVYDALESMPLYDFMKPDVCELAFYDTIHSGFPQLSLN